MLFVIFTTSSVVIGLDDPSQAVDPMEASIYLLLVSLVYSLVITYPVVRSKWFGLLLMGSIFIVIWGLMTFQFIGEPGVGMDILSDLFLQGFIIAFLFSVLVVLINGKTQKEIIFKVHRAKPRLNMHFKQWVWKLILISLIYVVLEVFVLEAFVAQSFSGGFVRLFSSPNFLLLKIIRGLVLSVLAIPIILMMKGHWLEAGLAVSLLFSVIMSGFRILPTEIMPIATGMQLINEVFIANFFFGWVVVWLLHRKHDTFWDLFRFSK